MAWVVAAAHDLEIEHRRVATLDLVADPDWATTRTFPTEGPALASGHARPIQAGSSRVALFFEAYSDITDAATPVTDAAVTVTLQIVTKYSVRDQVVVSKGQSFALNAQERAIEVELPQLGKSFVRITAIASVGGSTAAIWIFADDRMTP